jgi:bidirectional [NiFe] hydrogenase diaphorase subunit
MATTSRETAQRLPRSSPGTGPLRSIDADGAPVDNRLKLLEATMKRHQYQPDVLIEVLHKAQELYGYLDPEMLVRIARSLKLSPSQVYGVATFYHFFSLKPQGVHSCVVCLGTACYVRGAGTVLASLERELGIAAGETTADGRLSLSIARCLGACGIAPTVVFDGTVAGHQNPEAALEHVHELLRNP